MTAPDLRSIAIHEAAHAWAFHHFGLGVGAVSIRPGRSHLGVTLLRDGPGRIMLGGHPLDGLDPAERRRADQVLVAFLIGEEATDLLMPRLGRQPDAPGYIGDPRAFLDAIAPAGGSVTPLPPATAAYLVAAEAREDAPTDYEVAVELAHRLVGPAWQPYVLWARAEARLRALASAPPIHALAGELLRQEVIDGPRAVAILTGT
jgi:hypothetical protein